MAAAGAAADVGAVQVVTVGAGPGARAKGGASGSGAAAPANLEKVLTALKQQNPRAVAHKAAATAAAGRARAFAPPAAGRCPALFHGGRKPRGAAGEGCCLLGEAIQALEVLRAVLRCKRFHASLQRGRAAQPGDDLESSAGGAGVTMELPCYGGAVVSLASSVHSCCEVGSPTYGDCVAAVAPAHKLVEERLLPRWKACLQLMTYHPGRARPGDHCAATCFDRRERCYSAEGWAIRTVASLLGAARQRYVAAADKAAGGPQRQWDKFKQLTHGEAWKFLQVEQLCAAAPTPFPTPKPTPTPKPADDDDKHDDDGGKSGSSGDDDNGGAPKKPLPLLRRLRGVWRRPGHSRVARPARTACSNAPHSGCEGLHQALATSAASAVRFDLVKRRYCAPGTKSAAQCAKACCAQPACAADPCAHTQAPTPSPTPPTPSPTAHPTPHPTRAPSPQPLCTFGSLTTCSGNGITPGMGTCGDNGMCQCVHPFTRSSADGNCWDERPLLARNIARDDLKKHMKAPVALQGVTKLDSKLDAELAQKHAEGWLWFALHKTQAKSQKQLYTASARLDALKAKTKTDKHPAKCKRLMLAWVHVHLKKANNLLG